MRDLVRRMDSATPPDRDRTVDALRAIAILGVVLGHWLVTALVADSGTLHVASPLRYLPQLAPVSWLFQTLAIFFLVGGQVAAQSWTSARGRGTTYRQWLGARMARLFRPVAVQLLVWSAATATMLASGVGQDTVHTLVKLAVSPLWFLLVFAAGVLGRVPYVRAARADTAAAQASGAGGRPCLRWILRNGGRWWNS